MVEFHQAIEEEDESIRSASECAEPLTPTSHTSESVFTHPFRTSEHIDDDFATPKAPVSIWPTIQDEVVEGSEVGHKSANAGTTDTTQPQKPAHSNKRGLGRRVGSFVKSKLHRRNTPKEDSKESDPDIFLTVSFLALASPWTMGCWCRATPTAWRHSPVPMEKRF